MVLWLRTTSNSFIVASTKQYAEFIDQRTPNERLKALENFSYSNDLCNKTNTVIIHTAQFGKQTA